MNDTSCFKCGGSGIIPGEVLHEFTDPRGNVIAWDGTSDSVCPCASLPCPPIDAVEISVTWRQTEYEPGVFAREVEEFYGGPIA